MDWYLIVVLLVLVYLISGTSEKFTEIFAFAGYKPPKAVEISFVDGRVSTEGFQNVTKVGVTNEDIQTALKATTAFVYEKTGLSARGIETNKFEKFTKGEKVLYKCMFMFTVMSTGFPFAFSVQSDVLDGKVVSAQSQTMGSIDNEFVPYSEETENNFLPFSVIEASGVPKKGN
jgi:hypothetical protein